jgi:hypothetical protein
VTVQAPKKVTNSTGSDIISCGISFGLYINAVETKGVLVDYSINAIIPRAAKRAARLFSVGSAVTHTEKKIDN